MRTTGRNRREEDGFSLIEVVIAAFILFVVVGIAVSLVKDGNQMLATQAVRADSNQKASQYARNITQRIRNGLIVNDTVRDGSGVTASATLGTALADPDKCSNGLEMRLFGTYTGVVNPGATVRFSLEAATGETAGDGIDNDSDGLIDEMDLYYEWWEDAKAVPPTPGDLTKYQKHQLGSQVKDLIVWRSGNTLTIWVTVMRYDTVDQAVRETTSKSTITLRN